MEYGTGSFVPDFDPSILIPQISMKTEDQTAFSSTSSIPIDVPEENPVTLETESFNTSDHNVKTENQIADHTTISTDMSNQAVEETSITMEPFGLQMDSVDSMMTSIPDQQTASSTIQNQGEG